MEIIHIVLGKANPDRLNGVNKVVYHLATEQTKAGKQVQVWGITANPVHDYPERNFKTRLFRASKFPFGVDTFLVHAIKAHPNAVFHLHGGWVPVFSSLAGILANHNIRFVLTPHGAYNKIAMKRTKWGKKIYFRLFEKALLAKAHKVHSIGESEVTGLHAIFPQATSFLLPYGFDATYQGASHHKNDAFTIGFVGRLDTCTKGLDILLEAFNIFQKTNIDSKLWIIGEGEGRAFIEKNIVSQNMHHVVLWGKKFGAEKDELIRKMHVFAHPSRNEGLPTAVLEAASMGVPSIVTQATNVASLVARFQAGIAIDDNNVQMLVAAMHQLYDEYKNNQIQRYRNGAKDMLQNAFSWPILVHKYDELYQ